MNSSDASEPGSLARKVRVGVAAGLIGGVCIWIYEAVVWSGIEHQFPVSSIPPNAVGLVFGPQVQASLGGWAAALGAAIHFSFAAAWGVLFALIWPFFRARRIEATLVALFYAVFAWVVMHVAIMAVSVHHPNYADPNVVIGGFASHVFFTVPLALIVKRGLDSAAHRAD